MKYGVDFSPVPVWRDGLTTRMGYTFLAVPRESDEYRAVAVRLLGSNYLKIKFYTHPENFLMGSDLDWVMGRVRSGSGPYLRGTFSREEMDKLLNALRDNPRLVVVPGTAKELVAQMDEALNKADVRTEGLGWHPQGNGMPRAETLDEMQNKRRTAGSFVVFSQ